MSKIDFENLRRVIMAGSADAARDAGLEAFAISVSIEPAIVVRQQGPIEVPRINVEIVELSEHEIAALRGDESN